MWGSTKFLENVKRAKDAKKVPNIKILQTAIHKKKLGNATGGLSKNLKIVSLANSIKDT